MNMKNRLYNEDQYKIYCEYMVRILTTDSVSKSISITKEMQRWQKREGFSEMAMRRLEDRYDRDESEGAFKKAYKDAKATPQNASGCAGSILMLIGLGGILPLVLLFN